MNHNSTGTVVNNQQQAILVTPPLVNSKTSYNEHKNDCDATEDRHLSRQNKSTFTRGNSNKGKLLTRSLAIKESTSPPRTPVPPPSDLKSLSPTVADSNNELTMSSNLLTPQFVLPPSQLDIEFPKLTPPKSKFRNSSTKIDKSASPDTSNNNSICEENSFKDNKSDDFETKKKSPLHSTIHSADYNQESHHNTNHNYYQNNNSNNASKAKPPLNMGSSSSVEGTSSGFISRDSSSDQFLDHHAGVDLVQFFKETLNKNAKDRNMLMKIERDMLQLALDQSRNQMKFPPMSSYNRMLIHRTAVFFGMDHNVDSSQQCVVASVTKETRIPEIRFKTLIRDTFSDEPKKSILKRESHSFEDYRQGGLLSVHRGVLNRKAKSFEEREEEYEKIKRRIFRNREMYGSESIDEQDWWLDKQEHKQLRVPNQRLLKINSVDRYPNVAKSHSFDGYRSHSGNAPLLRDDSITSTKSAGPRLLKQDSSTSTTWRLSPSSSGYKTQSLRSDSITPSPTGNHTPEPSEQQSDAARGVVWAVTDMAKVPKGSVLIDPQTLQPIVNEDGTIYHFDPSNPPTTSCAKKHHISTSQANNSRQQKYEKQKSPIKDYNRKFPASSFEHEDQVNTVPEKTSKHNTDTGNNQQTFYENKHQEDPEPDETPNTPEIVQESSSPDPSQNSNLSNGSSKDSVRNDSISLNLLKPDVNSPKHKNQATSPNLPLAEQPSFILEPVTNVSGISTIDEPAPDKKELTTLVSIDNRYQSLPSYPVPTLQTMPIMGYAQTYPSNNIDSAVYGGATYQTGPDGTIYVLSQPMMYSYATTPENDMSSYLVPVYDPNTMQSRPEPTTVLQPLAYPQAATNQLYQNQVVYSTTDGYPMSYAVNGAGYQNYWGQPMTYLIPQSHQTGIPQSGTPAALIPAQNNNITNSQIANGKRSSPNSSNSSTTTTFQQFPQSVPLAPSMYQNVVQYPATNFYPPQQNPLVGSMPHQATNQIPQQTYSAAACTEVPCYPYVNQSANNPQTPQSTPGTPLSLTNMSAVPHSKNVPLFATPPVLAAPEQPSQATATFIQATGGNVDTYEKRYSNGTKKKENGNCSFQYNAPINGKANAYVRSSQSISNPPISYQKKPALGSYNNNIAGEDTSNNGISYSRKNSYSPSSALASSSFVMAKNPALNSGTAIMENSNGATEKFRPRLPPVNLDLKRNNLPGNTRSTPSTNSTESNNSPNSIKSYENHRNNSYPSQSTTGYNLTHRSFYGSNPNSAKISDTAQIQTTCFPFNVYPNSTGSTPNSLLDSCHHQTLFGTYNPAAGMYVKFGQAFGFNPSMQLQNRKSPSSDVMRPPLATSVYSTMMLPGPRHLNPRTVTYNNPNYKGNRPQR